MTDAEIEDALMASRVHREDKKPSVEAVFHAYLLTLPDVDYVGHTHATAVNQILCSPRGREFAEKRMFPDEIVCCGVASVYLPYTDPGLPLAKAIRTQTREFVRKHATKPRVLLIQNHGVIAIGKSPESVWSTMWMTEKAARIWVGAAVLSGPEFLAARQVRRIAGRRDEHYRQRVLCL
jgi:rhamnose utilization protein RhaD (predicted bifunctional aldolase and dehydrogenase)